MAESLRAEQLLTNVVRNWRTHLRGRAACRQATPTHQWARIVATALPKAEAANRLPGYPVPPAGYQGQANRK